MITLHDPSQKSETPPVAVVGAGLAGLWVTVELLSRGISVDLYEEAGKPGARASGNPAGLFKPILTPTPTPSSRLSFLAFEVLLERLDFLRREGLAPAHSTSGLLQVPRDLAEAQRFQKALKQREISSDLANWLDPDSASERAGVNAPLGGIWFARGGWLSPVELCARLLELAQRSQGFRWFPEAWAGNRIGYRAVVYCVAERSRGLPEFQALGTQVIRGQISEVLGPKPPFQSVLAFHDYGIPLGDSRWVFGATHDRGQESLEISWADHQKLWDRVAAPLGFTQEARPAPEQVRLRVGLRFTMANHLPVVSALPQTSEREGVPSYCLTALGSRGILLAPILAEHLVHLIVGQRSPLASRDPELGQLVQLKN